MITYSRGQYSFAEKCSEEADGDRRSAAETFRDGRWNSGVYDYIGVPYPEGYIRADSAFLFNHEDIKDIVFGFEDEEREGFLEIL